MICCGSVYALAAVVLLLAIHMVDIRRFVVCMSSSDKTTAEVTVKG